MHNTLNSPMNEVHIGINEPFSRVGITNDECIFDNPFRGSIFPTQIEESLHLVIATPSVTVEQVVFETGLSSTLAI